MIRTVCFLLIPTAAYAHGEQIMLFFDTVFLVALIGIIVLTDYSKSQKLLMSVLLVVIHLFAFITIEYTAEIIAKIILVRGRESEIVVFIVTFLLLYIIPFFLSLILGKFLTKDRKAKF